MQVLAGDLHSRWLSVPKELVTSASIDTAEPQALQVVYPNLHTADSGSFRDEGRFYRYDCD